MKIHHFNKTWGDFIKGIKTNEGHKFVNNGGEFSDKEENSNVAFVKAQFERCKRTISPQNASLFISIVGRNRGFIISEVQKMAYTAPKVITEEYIKEAAYPNSKEAVLYKFGNALDEGYASSLIMMDAFLDIGVNENVLAEIIAKKARWRLAAIHLFSSGMNWRSVEDKLIEMGRFPSCVWYSSKASTGEKRKISKELDKIEPMQEFMVKKLGIPTECLKPSDKKKTGDCLPMPFLASQICEHLKAKWVVNNQNATKDELLDKALNDYLSITDGLKEIRFNGNPRQDLLDTVITITNNKV